jgi:hypothetical protein
LPFELDKPFLKTAEWGKREQPKMDENTRIWVEILFNITYLAVIWVLAAAMFRKLTPSRLGEKTRAARLAFSAFALLALGDSGHVGFRVYAYLTGGLEQQISLFGLPVGLVGMGALATAVTVTLFYMLILELWRVSFRQPVGWAYFLLMAAGVVRLGLMIPPNNEWNALVPPQPWSLIRNLPLILQGVGAAFLILRSALPARDRTFTWIGGMILVSYACYLPVILFVQQAPLVGMLMIPKTMAYVAVGFLVYNRLFKEQAANRIPQKAQEAPAN